jgi:hypothetical protein
MDIQINRRSAINIAAALLIPIFLQALFISLFYTTKIPLPWVDNFYSEFVFTGVGILFLARQFRWWSILVALAYAPGMFAFLVYFAVVFNSVFGNSL